jgi:hypothetical protein
MAASAKGAITFEKAAVTFAKAAAAFTKVTITSPKVTTTFEQAAVTSSKAAVTFAKVTVTSGTVTADFPLFSLKNEPFSPKTPVPAADFAILPPYFGAEPAVSQPEPLWTNAAVRG